MSPRLLVSRNVAVAATLIATLALSSCGDDGNTSSTEAPEVTSSTPADPTADLRERCASAVPEGAEMSVISLEGASNGSIQTALFPAQGARTVVVALPQTSGVCGWSRFAHWLASERGIATLAVNPCGYGESECSAEGDADPVNEVAPAIAHARDELGAKRVVLAGTSMGGSLTVMAMSAGADADAWADISGPSSWDGADVRDGAAGIDAPGLVLYARSDGAEEYRAAKRLAADTGATFLDGGSGHGWELLIDPVDGRTTQVGRKLADWIATAPAP